MNLSKDEIKKIVEGSYLKADHEFKYPPVCLEITGEYGNQIFSTLGNFAVLIAPPKVGKTTATGVIVASLLIGGPISNFNPSLPEDKKVIAWADTEQGESECVKTIRSICIQATGNKTDHPVNLKYSSLRNHGRDVRLAAIEYIVYNTPNLGFLVIDGIRDLVSSINDEREATIIADKLLKWTQEMNIHILTILHQNKGDANARGHIGTELINKAESVATISRGENAGIRTTIFESKYSRHKEFESFAFTINDGIVYDSEINNNYEPKNPKVDQLTYHQILDLFRATFENDIRLTYKPVCDSIQVNLKKVLNIEFGIDKTKKLVKWLKDEKHLNYDEKTKTYFANMPL